MATLLGGLAEEDRSGYALELFPGASHTTTGPLLITAPTDPAAVPTPQPRKGGSNPQIRTLRPRTETLIVASLRRAFSIIGIGVHDARNRRSRSSEYAITYEDTEQMGATPLESDWMIVTSTLFPPGQSMPGCQRMPHLLGSWAMATGMRSRNGGFFYHPH